MKEDKVKSLYHFPLSSTEREMYVFMRLSGTGFCVQIVGYVVVAVAVQRRRYSRRLEGVIT